MTEEIDRTCIEEGCENRWRIRRLCNKHYLYRKRRGTLPPRIGANKNQCSVEGCTNVVKAKGLCAGHRLRQKKGWPDWDTRPMIKQRKLNFNGPTRDDDVWEYRLHRHYGLEKGAYARMLEEQGGGCAICGNGKCPTGRRLAVDHDHKTGKVRGLLCAKCNHAIGKFEENIDNIMVAIIYLLSHSADDPA